MTSNFLSLAQSINKHSSQYKKKTVCYVHKFCSSAVGNGLLQPNLIQLAVGIGTCYEMDGPGTESKCRPDFPHPSKLGMGPTQPPIQWGPGLSQD